MNDDLIERYSRAVHRYLREAEALERGRGSRDTFNGAKAGFEAIKAELEAREPTLQQLLDAFAAQVRASGAECRKLIADIFSQPPTESPTE